MREQIELLDFSVVAPGVLCLRLNDPDRRNALTGNVIALTMRLMMQLRTEIGLLSYQAMDLYLAPDTI